MNYKPKTKNYKLETINYKLMYFCKYARKFLKKANCEFCLSDFKVGNAKRRLLVWKYRKVNLNNQRFES
jgi:hypothetical protein